MEQYNHNMGPLIVDAHPDDRMKYAPWNLRDFLRGVQGLRPDEIGIYAIILNLLYDTMGQLKDDDYYIAGHCKCEVRYYRKLRKELIAAGKIYEADGYLYNNRAMAEIAKFCETSKRKREAAAQRELQKREAREAIKLREQQQSEMQGQLASQAPDARLSRASRAPDAHGAGAYEDVENSASGKQILEKLNEISVALTTAVTTAVPVLSTYKEKEREIERKIDSKKPPLPPCEGGGADAAMFDLEAGSEQPPEPADAIAEQFEAWWQAYPGSVRKVGKGECKALFREAITGKRRPGAKRESAKILDYGKATAEQLIAAAKAYAATKPDPQFVPAPATWLNQGRWMDQPQAASGDSGQQPWWVDPAKVEQVTPERWRSAIGQHANGIWPTNILGPPPGSPRCVVPHDLVRDLRLTEKYTTAGIRNPNYGEDTAHD